MEHNAVVRQYSLFTLSVAQTHVHCESKNVAKTFYNIFAYAKYISVKIFPICCKKI